MLVLLAGELDSGALSSATRYDLDDIEAGLIELAEDADNDAERVRAALDEERSDRAAAPPVRCASQDSWPATAQWTP